MKEIPADGLISIRLQYVEHTLQAVTKTEIKVKMEDEMWEKFGSGINIIKKWSGCQI